MKIGEIWKRIGDDDYVLIGRKIDDDNWDVASIADSLEEIIRRDKEGFDWFYTSVNTEFLRNNFKKVWVE